MAKFRALEKSFVNNSLHEEGDVIDYDVPEGTEIGDNLEPIDEKPAKSKTKDDAALA